MMGCDMGYNGYCTENLAAHDTCSMMYWYDFVVYIDIKLVICSCLVKKQYVFAVTAGVDQKFKKHLPYGTSSVRALLYHSFNTLFHLIAMNVVFSNEQHTFLSDLFITFKAL